MNLGNAIKSARQARGYTQKKLAEFAGISVSHLCLVEKSKRDPSISTVNAISGALGIPLSVLMLLASNEGEIKELGSDHTKILADSVMELMRNAS